MSRSSPRPRRLRHLILAATLTFAASAASLAPAAERPGVTRFTGPHLAATLAAPPRNETSGLAASRRNHDLFWLHDDSGGPEEIYAVGSDGSLRATLKLKGIKNKDWEDIASVDLDHKPWLVLGDIGDNDAKRKHISLSFIEEPAVASGPAATLTAAAAATYRITFSDGPRDCESLAIDPVERAVYLLSKRDATPRLYRAALPAGPLPKTADLVAEFVLDVPQVARPTGAGGLIFGLLEKGRARPCGMDFAADGSAAAVVTYVNVAVFPRAPGESWTEAFARPPIHLPAHELPQAEAICFARDGAAIFVASEETRKLLRYDRAK